MKMKYTATPT